MEDSKQSTDSELDSDFAAEIAEAQRFIEEKYEEPEPEVDKTIIKLTEEESLQFKNFNLQLLLADKSIENIQLKQSLLIHEKQAVINQIKDLKIIIQNNHQISIDDYVMDLANKRWVHNKLLKK